MLGSTACLMFPTTSTTPPFPWNYVVDNMNSDQRGVVEVRRGLPCRGDTSWASMSWTQLTCRVSVSWSLDHVVGSTQCVVDSINVCRG